MTAALVAELAGLRARVREARGHLRAAAARLPGDDDLDAARALLRDPDETPVTENRDARA